jgi:hypothetical protein
LQQEAQYRLRAAQPFILGGKWSAKPPNELNLSASAGKAPTFQAKTKEVVAENFRSLIEKFASCWDICHYVLQERLFLVSHIAISPVITKSLLAVLRVLDFVRAPHSVTTPRSKIMQFKTLRQSSIRWVSFFISEKD